MAARVRGETDAMEDSRTYFPCPRPVPFLFPRDARGGGVDTIADARIAEGLFRIRIPFLVEIFQPELDGVHADGVRRLLHHHLQGERAVRMAHTAIWPGLVAVGKDVDGLQLQVGNLVDVLHVEPGAIGRACPLRADVGVHAELTPLNGSIAVHAQFHLVTELRPVRSRDEVFLARIHRFDRPSSDLCKNGGVHFSQVDAGAVTVSGTHVAVLNYTDAVRRDLQCLRQAGPRPMGVLVGVVHNQPVLIPVHQRVRELQRQMLFCGFRQDGVDGHVGARSVRIAADERRSDGDNGPVLFVVPLLERRRADAIHHLERSGQHFILDLDEMDRLVGDVFVLGRHNRDGRSNLEYLLVEQIPVRRPAA